MNLSGAILFLCLCPAALGPVRLSTSFRLICSETAKFCLAGCNTEDSLRFSFFPHLLLQGPVVISHSCQMQENIDFQKSPPPAAEWTVSTCAKHFFFQNPGCWKSLSKLMYIVFNECGWCAPTLELCCIELNILPCISIPRHQDNTSQCNSFLRHVYLMFCNKTASWKTLNLPFVNHEWLFNEFK